MVKLKFYNLPKSFTETRSENDAVDITLDGKVVGEMRGDEAFIDPTALGLQSADQASFSIASTSGTTGEMQDITSWNLTPPKKFNDLTKEERITLSNQSFDVVLMHHPLKEEIISEDVTQNTTSNFEEIMNSPDIRSLVGEDKIWLAQDSFENSQLYPHNVDIDLTDLYPSQKAQYMMELLIRVGVMDLKFNNVMENVKGPELHNGVEILNLDDHILFNNVNLTETDKEYVLYTCQLETLENQPNKYLFFKVAVGGIPPTGLIFDNTGKVQGYELLNEVLDGDLGNFQYANGVEVQLKDGILYEGIDLSLDIPYKVSSFTLFNDNVIFYRVGVKVVDPKEFDIIIDNNDKWSFKDDAHLWENRDLGADPQFAAVSKNSNSILDSVKRWTDKFIGFGLPDEKTKSEFFQHPVILNLRSNPVPEEIMSDLEPDEALVIQLSEMTVAKDLGKNTKGIKLYLHCNSIVASLIDDHDDIIQVVHKGKIIGAISNGKTFICNQHVGKQHERDIICNKDNNPDDFDYLLK